MSDIYSVKIGDIVFSPRGENNIGFTTIKDWYSVPTVRGSTDPHPAFHGNYPRSNYFRDSRLITVNGILHAETRAQLENIRHQTIQQLTAAPVLSMQVSDQSGTWCRNVEIQQISIDDTSSASLSFPITIDALAADPIRYSLPQTTSQLKPATRSGGLILPASFPWHLGEQTRHTETIYNSGSIPLKPIIKAQGSADSIKIMLGAHTLNFPAFNGLLVFDCRARRVFLNRVDVSNRFLAGFVWASVAPGERVVFGFESVNPSDDLSVSASYVIGVW